LLEVIPSIVDGSVVAEQISQQLQDHLLALVVIGGRLADFVVQILRRLLLQ
jgi:hypothetical protein